MKNILKPFCFLLVLITLSSCFKEEIELDLNSGDNQKLAVFAWIDDGDTDQEIVLTLSSDYLDSLTINEVTDAKVTMSANGQTLEWPHQGNGIYSLPGWRAVADFEYTLSIEHGGEIYESSSYMKPMPVIENIKNQVNDDYDPEEDSIKYYDVLFDFQDPTGEGDGYYGIDFKKGTMDGDTLLNGGFTDDEFVDGILFTDIILSDEDEFILGDTVILEAYSIGMEASSYLQDVLTEVFREGIFDPPPVNVRSNITNGALGYFIASGIQREEYIITE